MATEIIKSAVRYRCDAPACAVSRIIVPADSPPDGYHGSVQQVNDVGATGKVPWFACGRGHIEAAIIHALDANG